MNLMQSWVKLTKINSVAFLNNSLKIYFKNLAMLHARTYKKAWSIVMIVRRATLEDLDKLAVLFDEYRQFYGASSNLSLSAAFLKQRFGKSGKCDFHSYQRSKNHWICIALFRLFFGCLVAPTIF